MVMIISTLVVVSFTILWADLDQAEAFHPGRAFIARTQQHYRQHQQHYRQQQHPSTSTTLWASTTKANATTTDPSSFGVVPTTPTLSLSSDWIANDFSVHPTDRLASHNNVVVGPSQILIYDTSLRGT
jgi:hypothetical protein